MSTIIAGHFQLQDEIERARTALCAAGFDAGRISAFYVNPAGQHDLHGLHGDQDKSPGAKDSDVDVVRGGATGAAVGAALGAATVPVTGPLGPAVGALLGAHVGSLYSVTQMKEAGEPEQGGENERPLRHAGMLIAVAVADEAEERRAVDLLRGLGVQELERADGVIRDGDWRDFNPTARPVPA